MQQHREALTCSDE